MFTPKGRKGLVSEDYFILVPEPPGPLSRWRLGMSLLHKKERGPWELDWVRSEGGPNTRISDAKVSLENIDTCVPPLATALQKQKKMKCCKQKNGIPAVVKKNKGCNKSKTLQIKKQKKKNRMRTFRKGMDRVRPRFSRLCAIG